MLKAVSALLFSAALFSTAAHAVIQDQQWGSWFGNINAMEFEINGDNATGEYHSDLHRGAPGCCLQRTG